LCLKKKDVLGPGKRGEKRGLPCANISSVVKAKIGNGK